MTAPAPSADEGSVKPFVDPACLCGRAAPCEVHGRFVGTMPKPHLLGPSVPDTMTVQERWTGKKPSKTDGRTAWVLAKEMAGVDTTLHVEEVAPVVPFWGRGA